MTVEISEVTIPIPIAISTPLIVFKTTLRPKISVPKKFSKLGAAYEAPTSLDQSEAINPVKVKSAIRT